MNDISSNAAYVISKIIQICGQKPGKKKLQKLVFLIQEKGIDLGYEYGLHFYGPYSSNLDIETTTLSAEGIIKFDYSSGYSHKMSITEGCKVKSRLTNVQEKVIDSVIERFKDQSPSELELLTTAIYAYNNLQDKSMDSITQGVKKIKGSKYSKSEIENALSYFDYFEKK